MNLLGQYNASAHSVYLERAWTISGGFSRTLLMNLVVRRKKKPLQSNDVLIAVAVCSAPVEESKSK